MADTGKGRPFWKKKKKKRFLWLPPLMESEGKRFNWPVSTRLSLFYRQPHEISNTAPLTFIHIWRVWVGVWGGGGV